MQYIFSGVALSALSSGMCWIVSIRTHQSFFLCVELSSQRLYVGLGSPRRDLVFDLFFVFVSRVEQQGEDQQLAYA